MHFIKRVAIIGLLFFSVLAQLGMADGLVGNYYNNRTFTAPIVMTRTDATIDFAWGNGNPGGAIGNNDFSVDWSGYIYFPENANYTFSLAHDDVMTLRIDGSQLYHNTTWTGGANNFRNNGPHYFSAGYYPISLQFVEWGGGAYAKLAWQNDAHIGSRTIIPTGNLFTTSRNFCSTLRDDVALSAASNTYSTASHYNDSNWNVGPNATAYYRTYHFTVDSAGTVDINLSRIDRDQARFSVTTGSTCPSAQDNLTDHQLNFAAAGEFYVYIYYVNGSNTNIEHQLDVTFTPDSSAPDEIIPTDDNSAITVVCDTFEDVFQTRNEPCPNSSFIHFTNHGQRLDASDYVIVDNIDGELDTCNVNTESWVEAQVQTCGAHGDCNASDEPAAELTLNYNNAPASSSVDPNPTSSSTNHTFTTSDTISGTEYNRIDTSYHTGITATFDIMNQLFVNEIRTTSNNSFIFSSSSEFGLNIGSFGNGSYGPQLIQANDGNAKNIKIADLSIAQAATIDFSAMQTIKINTFSIGRGGSNVNLEAQYVNIDTMEFTNSGTGQANILIRADYIDIGTLDFGQGATLTIEPFTPGNRVLFRSNSISATSSSSMIIPSGNYYTGSFSVPGCATCSSVIASGPDQLINFYINGDFNPGNNPGINSDGNNGNFGSNPAANFMLFINGDMNTGGGGTTFNATIYVEGDVTMGNPTYIRGALSAHNSITVGTGQFFYDQSISDGGWGECSQLVDIEFEYDAYELSEDIASAPGTSILLPVMIKLSAPTTEDVTITYYTTDGSATVADGDYKHVNKSATISAGDLNTTIILRVYNDQPIELEEEFYVHLANPQPLSHAKLGLVTDATITIREQDDAPICFEDDFSGSVLNPEWRVLSASGYVPQIVNSRLRLTDDSGNRATALTYDKEFNTQQNLIIVEFDYHAYGGCNHGGLGSMGADGIVSVLFDSAVGSTPIVGSFGGSMGYAQRNNGDAGFQGGWLGVGLDEYGNFVNCNEGRNGGPAQWGCPGAAYNAQSHAGVVGIRGDGVGQTGYEYLTSTNDFISPPLANKAANDYNSGRFKYVVDARDPAYLYIYLDRDTSGQPGQNYNNIIYQFDAKAPQYNQGTTPQYVRWGVTAGTGGGCNYHEFSWIRVKGDCGAYAPAPGGAFRIFEENGQTLSWYNVWNQNQLRTQLFEGSKRYCVVAGTSGSASADPYFENVDVNITLIDFADGNATLFPMFTTTIPAGAADTCFDIPSFDSAAKHALFVIERTDGNGDRSISDPFAIRPATYSFTIDNYTPGDLLTAGKEYNMSIRAQNVAQTNQAVGYYQSFDANYDSNATLFYRSSFPCSNVVETYKPISNLVFVDGFVDKTTLQFDNVMEVDVMLKDSNWTGVDESVGDCIQDSATNVVDPASYRVGCDIEGSYGTLEFVPDRFEIVSNFIPGANNYTYLAQRFPFSDNIDRNMALNLQLNITALNAAGDPVTYYDGDCYGKYIDISYDFKFNGGLVVPNGIDRLLYLETTSGYNSEINGTIDITSGSPLSLPRIPKGFFVDGNLDLNFYLNFNRQITVPVEPFIFTTTGLTVTDEDGINGTDSPDNDEYFLYGRAHAPRYRVNCNAIGVCDSGALELSYEFFSRDFNKTLREEFALDADRSKDAISWFINTDHTVADGNITGVQKKWATANVTIVNFTSDPASTTISYTSGANAGLPYKTTMQILTQPWLIYNRFDNAATANDFELEFNLDESAKVGADLLGEADQTGPANTSRRIRW